MDRDALDTALLEAHRRRDRSALVALYTQAADACRDEDAAAFYLTHAYVFALEAGDPAAKSLNARLVAKGRAHPVDL